MKRYLVLMGATFALIGSEVQVRADDAITELPIIHAKLSLADAVSLARTDNLTLHQSQADADLAASQIGSSRAQTGLSVSANSYATTGNATDIVASAPGSSPSNYLGTPPRSLLDQNVAIMFPLYTGGRLEGLVHAARAQSTAATLAVDQAGLGVNETVTDSYVAALLQDAMLDAAKSRLAAEDEQVRITKERVDAGRSAPVDLLREQAEQADANQAVLAAANDQAESMIELKAAMGVSQESDFTLSDSLTSLGEASSAVPSTLTASIELADKQRPDLAAAQRQVEAAKAAVGSAHGEFAPQVYAVGMADVSDPSMNRDQIGYTVGLVASLPLYDSGARNGEVDAAKSRLARAVADAQVVRQSVDVEVATAWLASTTAVQAVASAQTGVDAAQQGYDLADMRYNAGKSITAERLDALSALIRAKADLAKAQAGVVTTRTRLLVAVGSR